MSAKLRTVPFAFFSFYISLSAYAELGRDWEQLTDTLPFGESGVYQSIVLGDSVWFCPRTYGRFYRSSDGENWEDAGFAPSNALLQGPAWIAHNGAIYTMGGFANFQSGTVLFNNVWRFTAQDFWSEITPHAPWSAGSGHAAVSFGGEIWLLGGRNKGNDVWHSPDGIDWHLAVEEAPWPWRNDHAAVVHNGKIWVLGGNSYKGEATTTATIDVNLDMDAEVVGPIDPESIDYNWRADFTVFDDQGLAQGVYIHFAKVRDGDPLAPAPIAWLWEWRVRSAGSGWLFSGPLLDIDLGGTLEFNAEGALVSARQYPEDTDGMETDLFFELNFGDPINQGGTGLAGTTQFDSNFQERLVEADDGSSTRDSRNDVWFSEDGIDWTEADTSKSAEMWAGRGGHKAVVCDGKMWVFGGRDQGELPSSSDDTVYEDIWHSADGEIWRKAADLPPWPEDSQYTVFSFKDSLWAIAQDYLGGGEYDEGIWRSEGVPWLSIVNQPSYAKGNVGLDRPVYEDREYQFVDPIPDDLDGQVCIRTLNNHKISSGDDWLVLEVDRAVTVFVAHDARFSNPPLWLQSWTKRDDMLYTTDTEGPERVLYQREFPAGSIELGGNINPGAITWNSMYSVIVVPIEDPTRAREEWVRFR
jgi:hypothetical protein